MNNANAFLKLPSSYKDICKIYPPSVNQVVGNEDYGFYLKVLTMSQEEIEDIYVEKNIDETPLAPIEYMLGSAYQNKSLEKKIKEAFEFFIHEPVHFLYDHKIIVIGNLEETLKQAKSIEDLRMIKEEDYFDFQNEIRLACGDHAIEPPNPNEDPRVKRIKAKARYRDKIKAQKGMGLKLDSTLIAICCMGLGITPLNIGEISYAAAHMIMKTYQEKDKYETDIKSLLAGADSKKVKPKYWIRNIDD